MRGFKLDKGLYIHSSGLFYIEMSMMDGEASDSGI